MKIFLILGFLLSAQGSFADYPNNLIVTIDKPKATYPTLPSYNGLMATLQECVEFVEEGKKVLTKEFRTFEVINSFCTYKDGTGGEQKGWRPRIEFFYQK